MFETAEERKMQAELERIGASERWSKEKGEKRDSQGRVRAEVLGGRSKAVISW